MFVIMIDSSLIPKIKFVNLIPR